MPLLLEFFFPIVSLYSFNSLFVLDNPLNSRYRGNINTIYKKDQA